MRARALWSCFSDVAAGGDGLVYDDSLGQRYDYDSNVINHGQVATGDLLVIRDRHLVYGYGLVESIDSRPSVKQMRRCPICQSSKIASRRARLPRYRCNRCASEFDEPVVEPKQVVAYSAWYERWWLEFTSYAPVRALDGVYAQRDRQNAIRRLDPARAHEMLRHHAGLEGGLHLDLFDRKDRDDRMDGGLIDVLGQRRIGQQRFRSRLLDRFGSTCAVTGEQPDAVLDAAHLYTYAERPVHEEDGGLLLRADVHRLFDRLLLTFDPTTWRSQVAPHLLARHQRLSSIHDRPIEVPAGARPRTALIAEHHRSARSRWKDFV